MRLTITLLKQHNHRMFRKHWLVQGKRVPLDMKSEETLLKKGVQIVEANTFLDARLGKLPETPPPPTSILPPSYHATQCGVFNDSNVLLLGMSQAQVLLNTLRIEGYTEKMEDQLQNLKIPTSVEKAMYQSVMSACVFDTEQVKLGHKKKDLERPAFNFPRIYGISDLRRNRLLFYKMIQNCEKVAPTTVSSARRITPNLIFKYPFVRDDAQLQFEIHSEVFISSKKPIAGVSETHRFESLELPNIFPASPIVSIARTNTYTLENLYPLKETPFIHPHTLLLHFSTLDVKHLSDIPVTDTKFESRALLKAFTVAASRARTYLGSDVKEPPQPIVIQAVQCDGKRIQFGIFQLNTLDLIGNSKQNYWYCSKIMNLYEECEYKVGKPVLEGYNREILKHMLVFYNNS